MRRLGRCYSRVVKLSVWVWFHRRAPAFCRNVRFIEGDPEGGEGSGGVAGVVPQGSGEVDRPGAAQHADGQVA
jgi:hypothetical protein